MRELVFDHMLVVFAHVFHEGSVHAQDHQLLKFGVTKQRVARVGAVTTEPTVKVAPIIKGTERERERNEKGKRVRRPEIRGTLVHFSVRAVTSSAGHVS